MLEFDEYKVWLNNFKPQLETLKASLGLDQAARELDLLQSQSAAPGFWDDPDKAQKTQQRIKALQDKIENQAKRERSWSDLVTLCEMGNEEEDASLLPELSEGCKALEEDVESARLATLLTGEYDNANAILTFHAGAGEPRPRTGPRCSFACTPAGRNAMGSPARPWITWRATRPD